MVLVVASLGAVHVSSQAPPPAAGPITELLLEGAQPAPVTSGLAFALTLAKDSRPLGGPSFDVRVRNVKGSLRLSFEELALDGERLHAIVRVKNATPVAVDGLRLDVLEATESYVRKAPDGSAMKDSTGAPLLGTKSHPVRLLPSPLLFGGLVSGADRTLLLQVVPFTPAPDAEFVILTGLLTGAAAIGSRELPDLHDVAAVDVDGAGRAYLAEGPTGRVVRVGALLETPVEVAAFGAPVRGLAVGRKTSELVAASARGAALLRLGAFKTKPLLLATAAPIGCLRWDRQGVLHGSRDKGADLIRFLGQGAASEPDRQVAGEAAILSYDFDAAGAVWVVAGSAERRHVLKAGRDGKPEVRLRENTAGKIGGAWNPISCRVDSDGNVYVAEEAGGDEGRLSVFDSEGRLVRSLAIAARPVDLAVTAGGDVFVVGGTPPRVSLWRFF
jgi:hypothetical protein